MTAAMPGTAISWRDVLAETAARTGNLTEARWLVEEVCGYSWPEITNLSSDVRVSDRARTRLESLVRRRLAGEPIQYVLGRWPFRTLDLMVDRRVLIPRPETEYVVEVALQELDGLRGCGGISSEGTGEQQLAVDLGTGSGAIGLSLAAERPRTLVFATDASHDALDVAAANLAGVGGRAATRVRLMQGDWWSALPADLAGRIDLVVSNPPYISSAEMASLDPVVHEWEPREALEAGETGLEAMEIVLEGAGGWLKPGGTAVVEIAPHQAPAAAALAERAGFRHASVRRDLAGRDRVLIARGAR